MSYSKLPPASGAGSSKLPIPRLHKQRSEPPRRATVNRQNRVSRACLSCRSRKIKCNGLQPRCSNCSENATPCVYASSRKDRLKTATTQNQDLMALLRDLRQQVSSEQQARIDDLLASVVEDVADAAATVQDPTDKYRGPIVSDERSETNMSAEVGSSGEPDLLDEDLMLDEETRAAGLVGKVSEIQWLRRLHGASPSNVSEEGPWGPSGHEDEAVDDRMAGLQEEQDGHHAPPLVLTNKASFYLDDRVFETDLMADPFVMPPFEMAERLLQLYMESAHNTFPILEQAVFVNRFYHYYACLQRGNPCNVPRKWQATLNMVFAIGAVYSHLTMADRHADDRDHLIYHSRAWTLSLRDPWWFSHPDLSHMQITGLLSFYYLSIGHINRALRSGFALGLHLPNEGGRAGAAKSALNSRIWWAHYNLERLVSALTGRPSLGIGCTCSVPLPLTLSSEDIEESTIDSRFGDESKRPVMPQGSPKSSQAMNFSAQRNTNYHTTSPGPANSCSYLRSMVILGNITQAALSLYGADTVRGSWESVQETIAQKNDELDAWATALPERLNFSHRSNVTGHRYRREQNILDIMYHSTKILITRPCLCRADRWISNKTASPRTFNQRAALLCVDAAKSIAKRLPDATRNNLVLLYQAGPWWQVVHIIMQALGVLLLEAVLEAKYFPNDRQDVFPSLKRLMRWLSIMRVNNDMAVRAHSLSLGIIKKLASTVNLDVRELISEDDMITSLTERTSAQLAPAQTHTPYPDVLNPVHEPHVPKTPSAAPMMTHRFQQQQQNQQQRQQYAHRAPSCSQYPLGPSHSESSQFGPPTTPFHPLPSIAGDGPKTDPSAYDNLFSTSSGLEQVVFPGWFATSFDEHDLFSS